HGLLRLPLDVRGDRDLDGDVEVAGALGGLQALAAHAQGATGGSARGDLHRDGAAVQQRDGQGGAEHRLVEGDGHRDLQVRAVGAPHGVLLDVEREQQVSCRAAAGAGPALAAQADLLPVVDACGDAGGDGPPVDVQPDLGAQRRVAEGDLRAGGGVLALGGAGLEAGRSPAAEACAGLAAEHLQQVVEVGVRAASAAGGVAARGAVAAAEHGGEDVLEAGGPGAALAGGEACAAGAHGADRVVLLALLGVVEHRVGLADLLERLLHLGVVGVAVGVVLPGLLAIGLLDLLRVGVLGDAEDRVEVLVEPVLSGHRRLLPGASGTSASLVVFVGFVVFVGNEPGGGPSAGPTGPAPAWWRRLLSGGSARPDPGGAQHAIVHRVARL